MRRIALMFAVLALAAGCAASSGPKEVQVQVTDDGFVPKSVEVAKGQPVTLVITRQVEATCATEAVFAKSGQKYDLPLHVAVRIPIPTDTADTLKYACGMDMYHGQVVVK